MIEKGVEMFDTLFLCPRGCFREFREFKEIKEFEVFPFMLLIFHFPFSISLAVVARGNPCDTLEVFSEERLRGEV
jgi:hypothetical protein